MSARSGENLGALVADEGSGDVSTTPPLAPRFAEAAGRFWRRVNQTEACWLWTGPLTLGYGRISVQARVIAAHRFSYEMFVGPIPAGLEIDHLCRVRNCVNPAHLEAVTSEENNRRMREFWRSAENERREVDIPAHWTNRSPSTSRRVTSEAELRAFFERVRDHVLSNETHPYRRQGAPWKVRCKRGHPWSTSTYG